MEMGQDCPLVMSNAPLRYGLGKLGEECVTVAAMLNVITHILRLSQIAHNKVGSCKGRCSNGLLVGVGAMNDTRVILACLVVNSIPHLCTSDFGQLNKGTNVLAVKRRGAKESATRLSKLHSRTLQLRANSFIS